MRARSERLSNGWRLAASGLIAVATGLVGRPALADDAQQFELLKGLFYAGQYEDVVQRLTILLDPSNPACATVEGAPTVPQTCHLADSVLIERCREMQIVALVALKRQSDADVVIDKILRQNPAYSPDPGALPATVVQRVREIKEKLQKELEDEARRKADEQRRKTLSGQKADDEERKWIEQLTELAATETIIEKRSRLIAFVPFGVGQFQNGDTTLGLVLLTTQAVAAGTAITLGTMHAFYAAADPFEKEPKTGRPVDRDALEANTRGTAIGNQVAFATWAALAIAGVVQANVAFVPEVKTTRKREVPKRPTPVIAPSVAPSAQGLSIGIVGTF